MSRIFSCFFLTKMIYCYRMSSGRYDRFLLQRRRKLFTVWRYTDMVQTILNVLLILLAIAAIVLVILYFLGSKLQKRQAEQQQMLDAAAQTVSILVIDKKKLKLTQSGLPKMVVDQTPKYMRWAKVPVVKAKIGPKVMTLIADV